MSPHVLSCCLKNNIPIYRDAVKRLAGKYMCGQAGIAGNAYFRSN